MLTLPSLRGKLTSGSEGLGLAPAVLQTLSYTGHSHATSSMDRITESYMAHHVLKS